MTLFTVVVVLCLHISLSVEQRVVPEHLRDVQDATRTQELLERAMPAIHLLVQRTQEVEIAALRKEITDLKTKGEGGAVFTRWGRRDCPTITITLYSGYTGGSHFTNTGAAADYLCMPPDPIWGPNKEPVDTIESVGYVYGAEYEHPPALFGMSDYQKNVPCAVCVGTQHSASVMIPGRTQCYADWTEAYHGNLASGYHSHAAASQYVCMDQAPQALDSGGDLDENGKLFYGVKSKCGSLPCPPYEDGKFLSCVVCVK